MSIENYFPADKDADEPYDTESWPDIDADKLMDALQSKYTRNVFEAGVAVLSQENGSKNKMAEYGEAGETSIRSRYADLEELGVFRSTGTNKNTKYEVHPHAKELGYVVEQDGWDEAFELLGEATSYPHRFGTKHSWNVFTDMVEAFRQDKSMNDVAEKRGEDYSDILSEYQTFSNDGFFSRHGQNYNPSYSVNDKEIAAKGIAADVERETLPGLLVDATDAANNVSNFVRGHTYANQAFRNRWKTDELPEDLIIPQWQEILGVAQSTALWDGTLKSAVNWLDCTVPSVIPRLERLPKDAVDILDEYEGEELSQPKYRVTVHPRFKDVFEDFEDRLLFDPDDVTYTELGEPADFEPESTIKEDDSVQEPAFRDYSNVTDK